MTAVKGFEIWQMPAHTEGIFMGLAFQKVKPNRGNYEKRYARTDAVDDYTSPIDYLEELFREFNIDHPADYTGRSLSVSDVVILDGVAYFCDDFGWKKLDTF